MNFSVDLAGLAALIVAVVTLVKLFMSGGPERKKAQADAATLYAKMASDCAEQNVKLQEQNVKLQKCNAALEEEKAITRKDIRLLLEIIDSWNAGINILLNQLVAFRKTPAWRNGDDLDEIKKIRERYMEEK